jgi:hypothetical protein
VSVFLFGHESVAPLALSLSLPFSPFSVQPSESGSRHPDSRHGRCGNFHCSQGGPPEARADCGEDDASDRCQRAERADGRRAMVVRVGCDALMRTTCLAQIEGGKIDVNKLDPQFGNSMLHWAARGSHLNLVQYLIEKGAQVCACMWLHASALSVDKIADTHDSRRDRRSGSFAGTHTVCAGRFACQEHEHGTALCRRCWLCFVH